MDRLYHDFLIPGGPATLTIVALGVLVILGVWVWLVVRYVRLHSATQAASEWARNGPTDGGGVADPGNPFLVELAPLAWGSGERSWRAVDRILSSADESIGSVSRLDRTALALVVLALAAVAAVGFSAWQAEVHLADAAGVDFWEFLEGEATARGLDARGLARSLSRGLVTAMSTLIVLMSLGLVSYVAVVLGFLEGPAPRMGRLEWLIAAALERRDPQNAARWSSLRDRVEARRGARSGPIF